jgi:hypothetical protein
LLTILGVRVACFRADALRVCPGATFLRVEVFALALAFVLRAVRVEVAIIKYLLNPAAVRISLARQ